MIKDDTIEPKQVRKRKYCGGPSFAKASMKGAGAASDKKSKSTGSQSTKNND